MTLVPNGAASARNTLSERFAVDDPEMPVKDPHSRAEVERVTTDDSVRGRQVQVKVHQSVNHVTLSEDGARALRDILLHLYPVAACRADTEVEVEVAPMAAEEDPSPGDDDLLPF